MFGISDFIQAAEVREATARRSLAVLLREVVRHLLVSGPGWSDSVFAIPRPAQPRRRQGARLPLTFANK